MKNFISQIFAARRACRLTHGNRHLSDRRRGLRPPVKTVLLKRCGMLPKRGLKTNRTLAAPHHSAAGRGDRRREELLFRNGH